MEAIYLDDMKQKYSSPPLSGIKEALKKEINGTPGKILVLDDDPTGIQTVHDVAVYTSWDEESIRNAFREKERVTYILTDSRSFTQEKTRAVHREIALAFQKISKELQIPYTVISRGDSTLRGHYPLETEVLRDAIEETGGIIDGEILCPFFKEGGRYTVGNIHYVASETPEGEILTPVGETEFAGDKTFGFSSSDLRQYIEEKTKGEWKAKDVQTVSLEELREGRVDEITDKLLALKDFHKLVVNALDYCDLEVFALAYYRAVSQGKRFLFRSASSLVKILGGIEDKALLTREELIQVDSENGGIIVVGSHTQKTTAQLEALREIPSLEFIEFDSDLVLDKVEFQKETARVIELNNKLIQNGKTVVNYTKRKLLSLEGDTKEQALIRSTEISRAVQSLVGSLEVKPAFVVAKGGITSSDVGTKALKVRRAEVLGQIQPGVPVWKTGEESRFPQIPYIIFPGNVGGRETLKKAVELLVNK